MGNFRTEQEDFWAGEFGDQYTERNVGQVWIGNNTAMFASILARTRRVESLLEFGANRGINLMAIRNLLPDVDLSAVEINPEAVSILQAMSNINVYPGSILDFKLDYQRDLVLSKGVLIHINPEILNDVYDIYYNASQRYICLVEYYNPTPVEVPYREHMGKLFKRDFAGEMLDRYPDLHLLDYGFVYHRDNSFPQDDLNWFVLEKR